jgi:hypothetical protein
VSAEINTWRPIPTYASKWLRPLAPLISRRSRWLTVVFGDSIYNRTILLLACFLLGLTLIIVRRIAGTIGFVVIPRRWIVIARTMLPYQGSNGRCGSTAMNSADAAGMMLPIPG